MSDTVAGLHADLQALQDKAGRLSKDIRLSDPTARSWLGLRGAIRQAMNEAWSLGNREEPTG